MNCFAVEFEAKGLGVGRISLKKIALVDMNSVFEDTKLKVIVFNILRLESLHLRFDSVVGISKFPFGSAVTVLGGLGGNIGDVPAGGNLTFTITEFEGIGFDASVLLDLISDNIGSEDGTSGDSIDSKNIGCEDSVSELAGASDVCVSENIASKDVSEDITSNCIGP